MCDRVRWCDGFAAADDSKALYIGPFSSNVDTLGFFVDQLARARDVVARIEKSVSPAVTTKLPLDHAVGLLSEADNLGLRLPQSAALARLRSAIGAALAWQRTAQLVLRGMDVGTIRKRVSESSKRGAGKRKDRAAVGDSGPREGDGLPTLAMVDEVLAEAAPLRVSVPEVRASDVT